jgi:hypothetical protein
MVTGVVVGVSSEVRWGMLCGGCVIPLVTVRSPQRTYYIFKCRASHTSGHSC